MCWGSMGQPSNPTPCRMMHSAGSSKQQNEQKGHMPSHSCHSNLAVAYYGGVSFCYHPLINLLWLVSQLKSSHNEMLTQAYPSVSMVSAFWFGHKVPQGRPSFSSAGQTSRKMTSKDLLALDCTVEIQKLSCSIYQSINQAPISEPHRKPRFMTSC